MARKKVETNVGNVEEEIIVDSQKNKEMEEMRKKIEEQDRKIEMLLKMNLQSSEKQESKKENYDENEDDVKINSDKYIKVMSLCPNTLNLTTEKKGRGKLFTFYQFGEVKRILYGDLVRIIENHPNFLNDGVFIIMDKSVIKRHGLDDAYDRLLKKEDFEKVLSGNETDAVNLFKLANARQRDYLVQSFIDRALNGESIDLNLLDRLSRIYGTNIQEKIENTKKFVGFLEKEKSAE